VSISEELCKKLKEGPARLRFLDGEDIDRLAPRLTSHTAGAGEFIWREGEPSDSIAFITQGKVELKKETEFTGSFVVVGLHQPGSVIGETCLFNGRRAITAIALEPTELVFLTRENLAHVVEESPPLGAKLLKGLLLASSKRLDQAYRRIASVF
jgi:SulP family sulfate permease